MDTMEHEPTPQTKPSHGGFGPVIGIIIIVILLVLGGVYYFTTGVKNLQNGDTPSMIVDDEVGALEKQSSSTELGDIEADLDATSLSGLDTASADFEAELNAQ